MEIKVCGSVSPYPKGKYSCPSFLITSDDFRLLLDCGAGSTRNLSMLKDLKNMIVFISHYHPDHYSDLTSLLYSTFTNHNLGYLDERVGIYLPDEVCLEHDYLSDEKRENYARFFEYNEKSFITHGNMQIRFVKNPHPRDTYAVRIDSGDASIVYSSDTGFESNKITTLAHDADILICEASYLKGFDRKNDTHLFAHEAAKIAANANVSDLYLFHTYPEIDKERYLIEAREIFPNTHICEDGMKLNLKRK